MLFEALASVFVGARRDAPVFKKGGSRAAPTKEIGAKNIPMSIWATVWGDHGEAIELVR